MFFFVNNVYFEKTHTCVFNDLKVKQNSNISKFNYTNIDDIDVTDRYCMRF